jgi:hypothetical protein
VLNVFASFLLGSNSWPPLLGAVAVNQSTRGYKVDIRTSNVRVVFSADKVAAKKVLQFLNENAFGGAISETLYETNSNRDTD